jgi:hypothetical protein
MARPHGLTAHTHSLAGRFRQNRPGPVWRARTCELAAEGGGGTRLTGARRRIRGPRNRPKRRRCRGRARGDAFSPAPAVPPHAVTRTAPPRMRRRQMPPPPARRDGRAAYVYHDGHAKPRGEARASGPARVRVTQSRPSHARPRHARPSHARPSHSRPSHSRPSHSTHARVGAMRAGDRAGRPRRRIPYPHMHVPVPPVRTGRGACAAVARARANDVCGHGACTCE